MAPPLTMPPAFPTGRQFANVFIMPRPRIFDPGNNVLLVANLFNFNVNGDRQQPDHDLFLGTVVAPLIGARPAAGARIVGLASRSGTARHNLNLSLQRARNIDISLSLFLFAADLVNPPGPPSRTSVGAQGEHFAEALNVRDGTEDARFRSVLITVLADRTRNTIVQLLPP